MEQEFIMFIVRRFSFTNYTVHAYKFYWDFGESMDDVTAFRIIKY